MKSVYHSNDILSIFDLNFMKEDQGTCFVGVFWVKGSVSLCPTEW